LPSAVLDALRRQPGADRLLAAAASSPGSGSVYLVGGSVRDLVRDVRPRELDVVVEGEIEPLLRALGGRRVAHDRFGTASVSLPDARIDVARSRREHYPHAGALPVVEPAPLAEDLLRRDFTVNAIAVSLSDGLLRAAPRAEEDLARGLLRVLHERSFFDDPTRLLRLGRYAARLGFGVEQRTAALAREALEREALSTVSGARLGAELRLALGEEDALAALDELQQLGVLEALRLSMKIDEPVLREALALLPSDGRPDLLLLAALLDEQGSSACTAVLLDELEFPASERDRVVATLWALPQLLEGLPRCARASELYSLAAGVPIEAVALAGALAARVDARARAAAERWLRTLRDVRLEISGHDLIAAGIPEGPEIGRRLQATLCKRLDGELADGKVAELDAALEAS
jgi:tRNA nucleotidyltransferase (CCA-adding enzyme)